MCLCTRACPWDVSGKTGTYGHRFSFALAVAAKHFIRGTRHKPAEVTLYQIPASWGGRKSTASLSDKWRLSRGHQAAMGVVSRMNVWQTTGAQGKETHRMAGDDNRWWGKIIITSFFRLQVSYFGLKLLWMCKSLWYKIWHYVSARCSIISFVKEKEEE